MSADGGPSWPLRRDPDFRRFVAGHGVSEVGTQFTVVALPFLASQTLGAGGSGVGLVQGSVYVAYLAVPLFAGVLVDRSRKRPILIGAGLVRFGIVLVAAALAWTGGLNLILLCALALAFGCGMVVFEVAQMAYLPTLVGRHRLAEANAAMTGTEAASRMVGPGLAGLLVQATRSPPLALVVDAASYLVLVLLLVRIRRPEPAPLSAQPPGGRRPLLAEIGDGLRYVFRQSRTVRALAVQGLLFNCGSFAFLVAFLVHATQTQTSAAGWYGLAFTAAGAGAVLGAVLVNRATAWFGAARTFTACVLLSALPFVAVPLAGGAGTATGLVWLAAFCVGNVGVGCYNVMQYTLRQRVTPDHLLGRMSASVRLVLYAGIPVGSVAGGLVSDRFGARAALLVAVAIMTLSVLALPAVLPALQRAADPADGSGTTGAQL